MTTARQMRRLMGYGAVTTLVAVAGGRVSAKPPAENVRLEVNGGAWTGTYLAASTGGGCTAAANGTWTNELYVSSASDLKALVNLPLTVPDAKAAANGTDAFYLGVGFGPLARREDKTYQLEVETRANQKHRFGTGTVTITDSGETAVVKISAKTLDGVGIEGTITCNSVTRKK